MVIDQDKMLENKIFLITDASDFASGAVLSFGSTWKSACPVAYDSCSFKNAELNYPVHEKELLAVVHALKKWKYEMIGVRFFVYTDHKTLLNFNTQPELSRRQARWMELMSIYDCKFVYIKDEDNTVADALSRLLSLPCSSSPSAEALASHPYNSSSPENPVFSCPNRENPMSAITSFTIHLPAPKAPTCSTITIDDALVNKILIGPLPEDNGFNCILTISDRLNSEYSFIPT
jgi:hypothetical protein